MLLKVADDKAPMLADLEQIRQRPGLDARTRRAIEDEIWAVRLGAKAEDHAAYQLDFDLKDNPHFAVIHDLRLDFEGNVAQIDHLVISRLLEVFVCESKSYTGGVKVNEHGEWTTFRDRRPVGIPSPVEQNRRHIVVLERAIKLGYIELPRRIITIKPKFLNFVLVSKEGSITRPRRKLPELESVVKVDQFRSRLLGRDFSSLGMLKLVSRDTVEAFGRQLVAMHHPLRVDWAARFGVGAVQERVQDRIPMSVTTPRPSGVRCAKCGLEVSNAEASFCRFNKARFDSQIYCMPCQQIVAPLAKRSR